MSKATGLILAAAGLLAASQVFYMSVEESLDFTESVLLVRVESVIEFPGDYMNRIEYYFSVLYVVSGPDSLEGDIIASYEMQYPRPYYDEEGNEIWESPIVSGSGLEMFSDEGDTVIVFLDRLPDGQHQFAGVMRIEPADSLESILLLLNPDRYPDMFIVTVCDEPLSLTTVDLGDYIAYVEWQDELTESITLAKSSDGSVIQHIYLGEFSDNLLVDFVTPEGTILGYTLKYLDMVDHDGDGFEDLRLLIAWGARGGQETYAIWYYDQDTETFQFYGVQSHGEMVDVW